MGNPFSSLLDSQTDDFAVQSFRRACSARPFTGEDVSSADTIGTDSAMYHSYSMNNIPEPVSGYTDGLGVPYDNYISPSNLDQLNKTSPIQPKSREQIHHQLLAKLGKAGYIQDTCSHSLSNNLYSHSLIVFDWDDTLLCTSYINSQIDSDDLEPSIRNLLFELETLVKNLLDLAISKGEVFIITNAAEGWVENSSHQYLPSCVPILDKVKIISARSIYEHKYPNNLYKWKIKAFMDIYNLSSVKDISNLICLGDSYMELEAAHKLVEYIIHRNYSEAYIKTVKFKECPDILTLINQLNAVLSNFDTIFASKENLSVILEKRAGE